MKQISFILLTVFFAMNIFAQQPLATFFTENGEKFWVFMDGKQINDEAMSRVEYVKMDNETAFVKIRFEDRSIPEIEKRIQGLDVDGNPSAVTWAIAESKKGDWKMKPSSWKKLDEVKPQVQESRPSPIMDEPIATESKKTTQTTTTTTTVNEPATTSMNVSGSENSFSMDIKINEQSDNANMSMNINLPGVSSTQSETHTSQTTVTTVTTTEDYEVAEEVSVAPDPLPGYHGRVGCQYPMSNEQFAGAKNSIDSKDFEDTKFTVAKQVLKSNCLLVSQVKEIMLLFDFEDTRLDFAKEAYGKTYDIDNYYLLNDAFDFESSIEELDEYINR
jgi:hypothetical protein